MTDIEPLLPHDVDLRGLPFMPLDTVRLLDSDLFALSTGDEFKAAVALWCKSWTQVPAASVPNDDRVLAHLSGAGARWWKLKAMALRGWILCSDDRFYHPVVAEKALEAWGHRTAQRARANKRWHRPDDEPGIAGAHATASKKDAAAYPAAMQGTGTGTGTGTVKATTYPPDGGLSSDPPSDRPPLSLVAASPPGMPPCPHERIVEAYHRVLPALPTMKAWSTARRQHLAARWKASPKRQAVEWWERLFAYIGESPFLMGEGKSRDGSVPFVLTLEWLVKSEANLLKVIEGNYHREVG